MYRQSSRKQPTREFRKVVATRAGRLPEWTLVSDQVACVADETKPLLSPSANQRRNILFWRDVTSRGLDYVCDAGYDWFCFIFPYYRHV